MAMATNSPVTIVPTSNPPRTTGPNCGITATATTKISGSSAGTIISRNAALVTMSTHVPYSGVSWPVMIPGCTCSCRRTSRTTAPAALPTASMLKAVKTNGSNPPRNKPMITFGSVRENSNTNGSPLRVTYSLSSCTYEPNKTRAAKPAEAIA